MPLHLSLHGTDGGLPNQVRIKLKLTYGVHGRRPAPIDLVGKAIFDQTDFRSDYWPKKREVDVVVLGDAYARGGARESVVSVQVGPLVKALRIFGDRTASLVGDRVVVSEPLPFERMPVTRDRAYGGIDGNVSTTQEDLDAHGIACTYDHPGLYPRNPHGRGYALTRVAFEDGLALPNIEWIGDEIAAPSLWVDRPEDWTKCAMPACIDFMPPHAYPRRVCFGGAGAWFPFDPADTRAIERARFEGEPEVAGIRPSLSQEAWPGMTLAQISGREDVVIDGMRSDHRPFAFALPKLPDIVVTEKERAADVQVRAETLVIEPGEERYSIVFGAEATLRKRYVPYAANVGDIGVRIAGGPTVRIPSNPPPSSKEPAHERTRDR